MKIILFFLATAIIVYTSRASLRKPSSHGFYRFFAWELMLLLFLLNAPRWFADPFSLQQIISWALLLLSLVYVLPGFFLLLIKGKADSRRDDAPMINFEKTTNLVTAGIYRYIRHPLYGSLLLLTWGIFFKRLSWPGLLLAGAATCFLIMTALREEAENQVYFGDAYREYMSQSRRFIPFVV